MNLQESEKEELRKHGYSWAEIRELGKASMSSHELKQELKEQYSEPISHLEQTERKVLPCPYCGKHTIFRKIECDAFAAYFCS